MHSRSDQVQAHTFMTGRLVSALVRAEPDLATPPLRRTKTGLIVGVVIGALIAAVVLVIGYLKPGRTADWRSPGALVVEKETGTRYVHAGGVLHPVLNLASAKLLLAKDMKVVSVAASALAGVERGTPVGIVGAPDVLPARPSGSAWSACATTATDSSGTTRPSVAFGLGAVREELGVPENQAVMVSAGDVQYLVWKDRKMRLTAPWIGAALGFDMGGVVPVRDAWLNVLPTGPDIGPLPVPDRGAEGPALNGQQTRIGQVLVVEGGNGAAARHFLLTKAGLQTLSATGAAVVLGDPGTAVSYGGQPVRPVPISPVALTSVTVLPQTEQSQQQPPAPPTQFAMNVSTPCVRFENNRTSLVVTPASTALGAAVGGPVVEPSEIGADLFTIQPGGGALARSEPAPGVTGAGLFLITEPGVKFPVPDDDSAAALGYETAAADRVPPAWLALLPTGPVLRKPAS